MCYINQRFCITQRYPRLTRADTVLTGRNTRPYRVNRDNTAVFSLGVTLCLSAFGLRQNCLAPVGDEFSSDFCFWGLGGLRRQSRRKDKKRRKGTLSGVLLLLTDGSFHYIKIIGISVFHVNSAQLASNRSKRKIVSFLRVSRRSFLRLRESKQKIIDF